MQIPGVVGVQYSESVIIGDCYSFALLSGSTGHLNRMWSRVLEFLHVIYNQCCHLAASCNNVLYYHE